MGEEVDTITQSLRFSATIIFTVQAVMLVITTPALQSESILTGEHIGGCIFDIEQAVQTNTMWAWFCTWGGEFAANGSVYSEKFTEKEILKKAYDSEYVITFDELPDLY